MLIDGGKALEVKTTSSGNSVDVQKLTGLDLEVEYTLASDDTLAPDMESSQDDMNVDEVSDVETKVGSPTVKGQTAKDSGLRDKLPRR